MSGAGRVRPEKGVALRRLARLHGVITSYTDQEGHPRQASDEAILAILQALDAPVAAYADAPAATRERRLALHRRVLPSCIVAFNDRIPTITLRLPGVRTRSRVRLDVETLAGDAVASVVASADGAVADRVDGETRSVLRIPLDARLPVGYYRVRLEGEAATVPLLVAPQRVHEGAAAVRDAKAWGVFLPVHAIRTNGDIGIGDLDGLGELFDWVSSIGGQGVGTLPLLAQFLDEPFEPSPYSPVSRLFFSEMYLGMPAASGAPAAPGMPAASGAPAAPGQDLLVDYRRAAAEKRGLLEAWFEEDWPEVQAPPAGLRDFLADRPEVEEYARFRAVGERRRESWHAWPDRLRSGDVRDGDWDDHARRFHLWAQWRVDAQLSALSRRTRERGAGLYLDLPLGVHPDGFDTWRHQECFARGVSGGAPPDPFFTRGQDWGFPPLRPDRMAESGFAYTIASIRAHLRHAGILRLDHVMGLHRQFWVPGGTDATHGVYVRYPAQALYAILAIESHSAGAAIVGEDLGTVPASVRAGMREHGVRGMYVGQFEAGADRRAATGSPAPGSVASLNTHDMATFAAFWTGRDLRQRVEWDLLEEEDADAEAEQRARLRDAVRRALGLGAAQDVELSHVRRVLDAWQERLAESEAALVLVNLEDMWAETVPQNVPGTWRELPNWRRRAQRTLQEIRSDAELADRLRRIDSLRRGKA